MRTDEETPVKEGEKRTKKQIVAECIFTIVLLFTLGVIGQIPGAFRAASLYKENTLGTAVKVEYVSSVDSPQKDCWEISIDYEVDGEHYQIMHLENKIEHPEEGDVYRVWYSQEDPARAYVSVNARDDLKWYVFGTLIGVLICVGCFKIRWGSKTSV